MKQCSIGGQAVMEGVMMRSECGTAIVVRRPDGTLAKEYKKTRKRYKKGSFPTWPFVRGVYSFVDSITNGMDIITRSAEMLGEEEEEEPSKFETWLSEKLHLPIMDVVKTVAVGIAAVLAIGLFVLLPIGLVEAIEGIGALLGWSWLADMNLSVSTILQGLFRLVVFLLYIWGISRVKEIGRVFQYHGAEHKTIACYESDLELTPENAKTCSRFHPRCGTNYLFLVMAVSIVLTTVFTALMDLVPGFAAWQSIGLNRFLFRLARVLLIPIIAGVSYEVLKAAANSDGIVARIVRAPGLALQRLTTREPDLDMLEVAIASFQLVLNPPDHDILAETPQKAEV
ncbi:MAG: DUF1385 domain-containing protein [Clostridia bacterium]|nr:DUF1385 domain-containing protein [Clostridia bacterium]